MNSILQNFFIDELLITKIENSFDCVHIELKSKKEFQDCPECNQKTFSEHSTY